MQEYLGIPNPCAGGVFEPTVRHVDGAFRQSEMLRIGVECELAVVLGADVDLGDRADVPPEDVVDAIESVAVAIEVVEDRYVDYSALDAPTLIADDFFGAGCVLGSPHEDWRSPDLPGVSALMRVNGVLVGEGVGSDILGHPLAALVWLAGMRSARGQPLRAGEFVLLGSLVQTHWVGSGDVVHVESPQLGSVSARIV